LKHLLNAKTTKTTDQLMLKTIAVRNDDQEAE